MVKYGFELKQWFVNRGSTYVPDHSSMESWCNSLGYRVPNVRDLTNASCRGYNSSNPEGSCNGLVEATPTSPNDYYQRYIGAGFFTEWGNMHLYTGGNFFEKQYWTSDRRGDRRSDRTSQNHFLVGGNMGHVTVKADSLNLPTGVCVYP